MSSFREIKITCPDCGKEGPYTIWDSVNVTLDPELKTKVLDGSIFEWVCPHCKKSFNAPYMFLYHDMDLDVMTYFIPEENHIIPFAAYIRELDNGINDETVEILASAYRDKNPGKNILFKELTSDKDLVFTILEMRNEVWQFTDKEHIISRDIYEKVCKETKK